MVTKIKTVNKDQLGASIRWHLNSGYRIERTYEIFARQGATLDFVTEIYEKIKSERARLARIEQYE
ncbi:hypothetical protein LEP1GSC166_1876 [Leptospira kirschneri]|uniref:hypothetical protein n=1 Tax=Leptospira kirschneri TaxID=29507 RepID=UPI0002C03DAF|nr:hypothetical protein [Leptospira kirschneri]EMK02950.1 hypothetical protein LEP1GSC166_1876 [Leptospira kirschneri]